MSPTLAGGLLTTAPPWKPRGQEVFDSPREPDIKHLPTHHWNSIGLEKSDNVNPWRAVDTCTTSQTTNKTMSILGTVHWGWRGDGGTKKKGVGWEEQMNKNLKSEVKRIAIGRPWWHSG